MPNDPTFRCIKPQCEREPYWQNPRSRKRYCFEHFRLAFLACHGCHQAFLRRSLHDVTGPRTLASDPQAKLWACTACKPRYMKTCGDCGSLIHSEIFYANGGWCDACNANMTRCRRCEVRIILPRGHDREGPLPLCGGCRSRLPIVLDDTTYTRNPFLRKIGFELEFLVPGGLPTHLDMSPYGVLKHDASVKNEHSQRGKAYEYASHAARGDRALELVRDVCLLFRRHHGFVNASCGFHVHLDMSVMSSAQRDAILKWWGYFEQTIFSFVPVSRHGNRFCMPRSQIPQDNRYYALNVAALSKWETYEVRLHPGTLNPEKVRNWMLFLLYAFQAWQDAPAPPKRNYYARPRLVELFQMLRMPLYLRRYLVKRAREFAHFNFAKDTPPPRIRQAMVEQANLEADRPEPPLQWLHDNRRTGGTS